MTEFETSLDASDFYYPALGTLMSSLQINSTPTTDPSCCNNSFQRHFSSTLLESQFFSFCSTIEQYSKNNKKRQKINKMEQNANANTTLQQNVADTPKRAMATTRKLRLFDRVENAKEYNQQTSSSSTENELSPGSLLPKMAMTRIECMQRRQEQIALNKKPMRRTSLRV